MESKLRIPRTFGKIRPREAILQAMRADGESTRFATVVSAPAGSGKTTLLAYRGRQLQAQGEFVAWLSLDQDDDDPFALWSGILGACEVALRPERPALDQLTRLRPPRGAVTSNFLAEFSDAVETFSTRLWLILDDVHELQSRDALNGLAKLMRTPPDNLRLMLACRYDPPLPVTRMRLDEAVREIREADLAFDRAETATLLNNHGLHLDENEIDLLLERTEGWVAGIKLFALWIAQHADPATRLAEFIGDDRPVADYLVSEVLSQESDATRELLLAVAVPERLTVELADELSGRSDAGAVLERLAHDNLFVYREDGPQASYRLHSLLRSYLLAELDRRDAEAKRALHTRASEWFDRHGATGLALDHATMSADWKSIADLLVQHGLRLVLSGDHRPVEQALRKVPDELLDRPDISLIGALCALTKGELNHADEYLARARVTVSQAAPVSRAAATAAHLYRARVRGAASRGAMSIEEGTHDPAAGSELDALITANRGVLRLKHGDFIGAEADLGTALHVASEHGYDFLALDCRAYLAITAAALDDADTMNSRIRQTLDFADAHGWSSSVPMVPVYLIAAWAAWESLDTDAADTMISLAGAIDGDVEPEITFSVEALRSYVDIASGSRTAGYARTALRRTWTRPVILPPKALSKHCLTDLRLALAARDGSWVEEVLSRADTLLADTTDARVMHALADFHRHRPERARHGLVPVIVNDEPCESVSAEIAAWLLEAHLAQVRSQPAAAHNALLRALDRAAPLNARRDLASASDRVTHLLSAHRGRLGKHETFVSQLMADHRGTSGASVVAGDALTERELDILHDLPSLLSLSEIAQEHVVSLNTIKTHLRAIYRKLDVNSRREAVERARTLRLI